MSLAQLTWPDRQAVLNAFRLPGARSTLTGTATTVGCLALGGAALASRLVLAEPLLERWATSPEQVAVPLLAALVVLPLLLTLTLCLGEARRSLFGSQAAELLLVAPVSRFALVSRAWAVCLVRMLVVQLALTWPATWGLVWKGALDPGAALALPVVTVSLLAPLTSLCIVLAIALRRWASSPRRRLAFNVVGGVVGIVLALAIGAGLVTSIPGGEALTELLQATSAWLPGASIGSLLAWSGGVTALHLGDLTLLLSPLLCLPLLALAARGVGRAWEQGLVVGGKAAAPQQGQGRWPTALTASVGRKDILAIATQRSGLAGLGFFLAVTVLTTANGGPDLYLGDNAPAHVALTLGLFNTWLMLVMLLSCLQGGTLLEDEAAQLDLLACAPIDRGALLQAKLLPFALPHLLILVAFMGTAVTQHEANGLAVSLLLMETLPVTAAALGLIVGLGTLPWLNGKPGDDGAQVRRVLVLSAAVAALYFGLMQLGSSVRSDIFHHLNTDGRQLDLTSYIALRAGLLWAGGLALFLAGLALGRRNMRALLAPKG